MRIKDLCPDDRPREKMRRLGAQALSNTELLAILIGSGTSGKNVTVVAQELLSLSEGRLALLGMMPLERIIRQKGIGEVRAITVCAALELGKRAFAEHTFLDKLAITTPEIVYQLMIPTLKGLDHEECWALFLNRLHYLVGKERVTSGSLESTLLDSQRILRRAIEKQSRHVILVHNHPSGNPYPSQSDIRQTDLIRNALSAVEISLSDHIIVSGNQFFSFSEERCGKMP